MSAANKPHDDIPVPGSPGSGTPTVEEPTEPREYGPDLLEEMTLLKAVHWEPAVRPAR